MTVGEPVSGMVTVARHSGSKIASMDSTTDFGLGGFGSAEF